MPSKEEAIFCKIAVKNNLLTIDQCKECIRLRQPDGKTFYDIVVEKGYLSIKMADVIKRLQVRVFEEEKRTESEKEAFDPGKTQQIDTQMLDDISSEITDSSTDLKLNLTDLGATIHPDVVGNEIVLPPKIIGNDTFMKNLSSEEQEEMSKLNLLPELRKSDNVVYNVNVQNYSAGKDSPEEESDPGNAITLRRSDLTDAQMLALIKGEGINLPVPQSAMAAQLPMQYVVSGQETIMAAVQKNMLISLLSVFALLLLGGIGIAAFIFLKPEPNKQIVYPQLPLSGTTIKEWRLYEVLELLDSHKAESNRKIGCEELTRRLKEKKDVSVIDPLITTCLKDDSKTVYREARAALESLKDPGYEIVLLAAYKQLIAAYHNEMGESRDKDPKRPAAEMKIVYMTILDTLVCPEIVPAVLANAIIDSDPSVREKAMGLLEKRGPEDALSVIQAFYEKSPTDPLAIRALNYFWNKCDKSKVFAELLSNGNTVLLCTTMNYVGKFKVADQMTRYAELVKIHPDINVKYAAINALKLLGAASDKVIFIPFDTTLKALKADLKYRKAILDACCAIRGPESDKILAYMVEHDSDAAIKSTARVTLAKAGTASGKALLADYDRRVHEAQVNAKKAKIEGLVAKIGKNDRAAMPELWKIFKDKAKLVDEALGRTALKDRKKLGAVIEAKYLEWGYVKANAGTWLDPWPTWRGVVKQIDAKIKAMDYLGAMNLLRGVDINLLKNAKLKGEIDAKKIAIVAAAEKQIHIDINKAKALIKGKKFPEALKHIDGMAKRYTKGEVVAPEWAHHIIILRKKWKEDEIEHRAWVYRALKSDATLQEVQQQLNGITVINANTTAWLRIDILDKYVRFTHNPAKIWVIGNRPQNIAFKPVTKKISDYSYLFFVLRMKKGWTGEVKITMNCGVGGQYSKVVSLGKGGGFSAKLDPSKWDMIIRPTGTNKAFQYFQSLVFDVTIKTKTPQRDSTYIELGEVKFSDK